MILSEYDRRWAEIRLYKFCIGVYALQNRSIDIIDSINLICRLGGLEADKIRPIVQAMMNDTYYQTTRREMVMIGHTKGISANQLGKYMGISRQAVQQYIDRNKETFTPIPRCNIEDDHNIIEFLKALEKFMDIERMSYGTIN